MTTKELSHKMAQDRIESILKDLKNLKKIVRSFDSTKASWGTVSTLTKTSKQVSDLIHFLGS